MEGGRAIIIEAELQITIASPIRFAAEGYGLLCQPETIYPRARIKFNPLPDIDSLGPSTRKFHDAALLRF